VEVAATPQQQNDNDCGVYVLAVARELCSSLAAQQQQQDDDGSAAGEPYCWQLSEQQEAEILQGITPSGVAHMREELLDVIAALADAAAAAAAAAGSDLSSS
jgi:hypothetical protein